MNRIFSFSIVFLFVLLFTSVFNECIGQNWVNINGGSLNDEGSAIAADKQGNIYVAGYRTFTVRGTDMALLKFSKSGLLLWERYYNGPGNEDDKAFGVVVDQSGQNIYITGYSTGEGSLADMTTVKYNSSGTQLWVSRYNAPSNLDDKAFGIVVDALGNPYITGFITLSSGNTEYYTVKLKSTTGEYIWGHLHNGTGSSEDKAFGIAIDNTGNNIYITGYTTDSANGTDFTTIKYDSSGVQKWVKSHNGSANENDRAFGIIVDNTGSIYVCGNTMETELHNNITLLKYSPDGALTWSYSYDGREYDDIAYAMSLFGENQIVVAGSSMRDSLPGSEDMITIRFTADGDTMWTKPHEGFGYTDIAYSLNIPKDREAIFVGGFIKKDSSGGSEDALILKLNPATGDILQESAPYNGTKDSTDIFYAMVSDTSNELTVTGITTGLTTGLDIVTMQFMDGNIIKVNNISTSVPKSFSLYQNYPNPFNPATRIRFDISRFSYVAMTLYDVLGKQVMVLVKENMAPGVYELEFTANNIASGVYFYELSVNGYREVKKMIITK